MSPSYILRDLCGVLAGCQVWHRSVLAVSPSGKYVAYASTLSIVVYDMGRKPPTACRVIPHDKTITCVRWSLVDDERLYTSASGSIILWSIARGTANRQRIVAVGSTVVDLAVDPLREGTVAVACADGVSHIWDAAGTSTREVFGRRSRSVAAGLRWNPKQGGMLLSGNVDGSWVVWDDDKRKLWCKPQMASGVAQKSRVVDLAWDPLGATCMLVAHECGVVVLWDVEALAELSVFERQPLGVHALAWLDWAPGAFVTVNDTTSVAKIWNVSQKAPLEHVRLAGAGVAMSSVEAAWAGLPKTADSGRIHSILPVSRGGAAGRGASAMFLAFLDGSIGLSL